MPVNRYQTPPQYAIFERKAQMCASDDSLVSGTYKTPEEAEAMMRYYGGSSNFYVRMIKPTDYGR